MDKYSDPSIFKSFNPSGEIIVALAIAFILIVLAIIVGILAKKADPLKRTRCRMIRSWSPLKASKPKNCFSLDWRMLESMAIVPVFSD